MSVIPKPAFSMRATLATAFALMGALAIGLALFTGGTYRELTLENQRESLQGLLTLKSSELLDQLLREAAQLGQRIHQSDAFRAALSVRDSKTLRQALAVQFGQLAIATGRLKLKQLRVFDHDFQLLADAGQVSAARNAGMICPGLMELAMARQGAERLSTLTETCLYQGRPVTTVLVTVGLQAMGYVQVIADTGYSLQKIGTILQLPLKLTYPDGGVAYESPRWQEHFSKEHVLEVTDWLRTYDGERALAMQLAVNVDSLFERLGETGVVIIAIAVLLTGIFIGLVLLVLQRMTFDPLQSLSAQVRHVSENGTYVGGKVTERGNTEVRALARDFNAMTDELEALYSRLEGMAFTDSLTSLPNRALFNDRMERLVAICGREGCNFALMIMDLDRFKEVNDALGHTYGDRLLQIVSQRLQDCVRRADTLSRFSDETVARLGGDEFAMVLPMVRIAENAATVAQRISDEINRPIQINGHTFHIGISIGIAMYPHDGTDPAELIKNADTAMYQAKRTQRSYTFYDRQQDEDSLQRLLLSSHLREAIKREELTLYYQPKVDLKTGVVKGVEALVRWKHPEFGFVPPDCFVGLAERNGLIQPLTQWVLCQAVQQCAQWHKQGHPINVAVNLSALSLQDVNLVATVQKVLEKAGLSPGYLSLELTESAVMTDPERALSILGQLDEMGVHLSVDDFGTGYSSLAYLKKLPVDEIKIDRSFIMEMQRDSQDMVIVRSTVDLGHNMGLQVIAEGVEDQAAYDRLVELGCDLGQGYHMGSPMPASELIRWLRDSPWGQGLPVDGVYSPIAI